MRYIVWSAKCVSISANVPGWQMPYALSVLTNGQTFNSYENGRIEQQLKSTPVGAP